MKILLCLALSVVAGYAAAYAAAIDGTVINGATGKPQAAATVTLFRVGQNGPEMIESVKSGADGKFALLQDLPGPRLLQAAFDGVTYNHMLPPGAPSAGITIDVYPSSTRPGQARVQEHMMLVEPSNGQLAVSESFVYNNPGQSTWNDPARGTLQFFLPAETQGQVVVNVLAPQGMPIRRAAEKTSTPNIYKVDFPIKPGESRIDLSYSLPFQTPARFESKVLAKTKDTKLVVPVGVQLKGDGLESLGKEPRTQASLFRVVTPNFGFTIEGTGTLSRASDAPAADENSSPQLAQVLPKLFAEVSPADGFWASFLAVKWVLLIIVAILALAFVLVYRLQTPAPTAAAKPAAATPEKHAGRRR